MVASRFILPLLALALATCATHGPERGPVIVMLAAINDFHGNLELPAGGLPEINAVTRELTRTPSGGVARMATVLEGLRAQHKHFAFVSAGDLVGASPLASGYFDDEPAIDAMNNLGLDLNGVGNHEFDRGVAELRRLQSGGCPREGCKSGQPFAGAKFQFLAANVTVRDTGKTLFAPYALREFGGVRVAFIGVTLRSTPAILSPKAVAGLDFHDEADTVNKLVPELQQAGVEAIVVLIHQGGFQRGGPNDCSEFRGPIIDLVKRFDRAVDVVVSGHTHQAYVCRIEGRLLTSAGSFGRALTAIELKLDRATRDVVSAHAVNHVVRSDLPENPLLAALAVRQAQLLKRLDRPVGRVTQSISNVQNGDGESPLGQLIADAQLEATRDVGAEVAFMNPGGIRVPVDYTGDGTVTYSALYAVQPFGNHLVTMTLAGKEVLQLLEQQWSINGLRRLQISKGSGFAWNPDLPEGSHIIRNSVVINGEPLQLDRDYRITVNNYLADGGDNLPILRLGRNRVAGVLNLDALVAYFERQSPVSPIAVRRARRTNTFDK
jgi:5'-nucleotidase